MSATSLLTQKQPQAQCDAHYVTDRELKLGRDTQVDANSAASYNRKGQKKIDFENSQKIDLDTSVESLECKRSFI